MGALLLVVLSCNTFEETMVNLYTSVFGGLAWAQSPGLAAGVLGPLHDNHLYLVVWPGHKAQAWRLESWDLYMITLENDEEELVQRM